MKSLSFLLTPLLFVLIISGCKKSTNNNPIGDPPPKPDTLSVGWSKIQFAVDNTPTSGGDIFFKSAGTGYLVNNSSIFKSVNAGNTWTNIYSGRYGNIAVTDDGKAFFVNNSSSNLTKTVDGGLTFTGSNHNSGTIHDIFFADNNNGIFSSANGLFRTADGGVGWTNVYTFSSGDISNTSLFLLNNTTGWTVFGNKVLRSNGSLDSWVLDSVVTAVPDLGLISVFATSPSVVYVSSYTGYFFKSVDGGDNFTQLKKFDNVSLGLRFTDIHFVDANTGYLSSGTRIYKTTDAGNTWSVIVALGNSDIIEIHFADAAHGWAVCNDGTILKLN